MAYNSEWIRGWRDCSSGEASRIMGRFGVHDMRRKSVSACAFACKVGDASRCMLSSKSIAGVAFCAAVSTVCSAFCTPREPYAALRSGGV